MQMAQMSCEDSLKETATAIRKTRTHIEHAAYLPAISRSWNKLPFELTAEFQMKYMFFTIEQHLPNLLPEGPVNSKRHCKQKYPTIFWKSSMAWKQLTGGI